MKNGKQDYQAEKAWDHRHDGGKRLKDRAKRNAARAAVKQKVGAAAIKGKDVGHKKAVSKGGKNGLANLFLQDPGANRSFRRNAKGAMVNERSKREGGK